MRWNKSEQLLLNIHKWDHHPHFEFPLKFPINVIDFDFSSGSIAKDSDDSDMYFRQFISDKKVNPNEVPIFTDGSRTCLDGKLCCGMCCGYS